MKYVSKKLRIIAVVSAIILVFTVLAGCKEDDRGKLDSESVTQDEKESVAKETEEELYKEHIKFTFSSVDCDQAGRLADGSIAGNYEWLTEKFNFEFDFISLNWNNYIDQTRLWLAAGDAPELMMLDVHFSLYPEYVQWVKEGLFRPYPEFGEKYPNLAAKMDSMITGKKYFIDGVLYAWPGYLDLEKYDFRQICLPLYRRDWAEDVGMLDSNDEYTWDEWIALIKEVIDKDPGGNGPGRTIGIHGKTWMFPKFFGGGSLSPYMEEFFLQEDGHWAWGPALPQTLEAIKLTRQLYDDGIIWKDQLVVQDEASDEPFTAGKSFAYIPGNIIVDGLYTQANDMIDAIPGFNPEKDLGIAYVKGLSGKLLTRHMPDQWSQTAMNKDLSDEKAERWLDILEYLVSDEGYYFRNLGIPSKDWNMENNELKVLWPEVDGVQVYPYEPDYPNVWSWKRSVGCHDGFALISPAYPDWVKDRVISAFERLNESDVDVVELDADLQYFSHPDYDNLSHKVRPIPEVVVELMTYKGDIEEKWDDFINKSLVHVNPVIEVLNESLK